MGWPGDEQSTSLHNSASSANPVKAQTLEDLKLLRSKILKYDGRAGINAVYADDTGPLLQG
jgi:hypothetical protein